VKGGAEMERRNNIMEAKELFKRAEKLFLECLTFVDEESELWKEIWGWMLDFDSLEMERKSIPTLGGREGGFAPPPPLSGKPYIMEASDEEAHQYLS